tara:strand:- start:45 stop:257 length:213 start_codon:yes stop_codon:yes gene_type:complete
MSYNGWRNRETWLVNIWFNPETKSDIDYIKDYIEEVYYENETFKGFWQDMIDINCIDWDALMEYCDEEEE